MRIAITGGIAEGKSTILSMLAGAGYPTFSADRMVAELWADPETPKSLQQLLRWEHPPTKEGIRAAISQSPEIRQQLNSWMHPKIARAMFSHPVGFFEVPLLVESCLVFRFDQVWYVGCAPEVQWERLMDRLRDSEVARGLIASQLPSRVKKRFAGTLFDSGLPLENLQQAVLAAAKRINFSPPFPDGNSR